MGDGTEHARAVGIALGAAMYYRGVGEADLAETLGVNRVTIYRWLKGATQLSAAHAADLTATLRTPDWYFLRPPETRERALAVMAAHDELLAAAPRPAPSPP